MLIVDLVVAYFVIAFILGLSRQVKQITQLPEPPVKYESVPARRDPDERMLGQAPSDY